MPTGKARNPAWYGVAIVFVLLPESLAQAGLFGEDNEGVNDQECNQREQSHRDRGEVKAQSQKHRDAADVHGVPDKPVRAVRNESFRGIKHCRGAAAFEDEETYRGECERSARHEQRDGRSN